MSQPYWVKVEIDFRLRLMWGWDELESKFRWNWVELGLSLVNVELIKKLCFHRIRVMVLNIFWSTHTAEQYLFLCFLQFLLLMLSNFFQFKGCFGLFGPKCAILSVTIRFRNCFGVYSYSATTFIFYVSFNSDIWFWLDFGSFLTFWWPKGLLLGSMWVSKTVLRSTYVLEQLLFSKIP